MVDVGFEVNEKTALEAQIVIVAHRLVIESSMLSLVQNNVVQTTFNGGTYDLYSQPLIIKTESKVCSVIGQNATVQCEKRSITKRVNNGAKRSNIENVAQSDGNQSKESLKDTLRLSSSKEPTISDKPSNHEDQCDALCKLLNTEPFSLVCYISCFGVHHEFSFRHQNFTSEFCYETLFVTVE